MEGFLRKRDNRWYAVVYVEDEFGVKKKREFSCRTDNKKQAQKFLNELVYKYDHGDFCTGEKMKLKAYLERFIHLKENSLSPTTLKDYKLILLDHVSSVMGDVYLDKLKPLNLQEYYRLKLETLSPSTVKKHHRVIKKALNDAVKLGLISKNPADFVDPPKVPKNKTGHALELDETNRLLEAVHNTDFEVACMLAMLCGLRRGEVCGLRWQDIDFTNNTIKVEQSLVKAGGEYIFKTPKSDDSIRKISAPLLVMDALRKRKMHVTACRLKYGPEYQDHDLVLCTDIGEHINPDWVTRNIKKYLKLAGIDPIRYHDLRHTNATIMLLNGIPLKVASERLGHSSVKITGDTYSHVTKSIDREASDKIDELYNQRAK